MKDGLCLAVCGLRIRENDRERLSKKHLSHSQKIPFAILAFAIFPFAIVRATSRPCSTTIFRMMGRLSSTTRGALHGCTKKDAILNSGWIYRKAKHDCDALRISTSKCIRYYH